MTTRRGFLARAAAALAALALPWRAEADDAATMYVTDVDEASGAITLDTGPLYAMGAPWMIWVGAPTDDDPDAGYWTDVTAASADSAGGGSITYPVRNLIR